MKSRKDHFDLLAPFYECFIKPKIPARIRATLGLPCHGVLLDAGGGTGRVAQYLQGAADVIIVADQSFDMLRQARSKKGLLTLCSLTESLPLADDTISCIVMVDALHHVSDQSRTAAELWRVLQPGGNLVIEEPDISTWQVRLVALFEKLALMRSHFLTPPRIASLFPQKNASLRIEKERHTAWIIVSKER